MNIASAVVVSTLGHDSSQPKRKAILLSSALFILAAFVGTLAAIQVRQASILHVWPYPRDMLFALTFCLYIAMLVCLVSSRGILNTETTTVRLLYALPLTEFKRWILVHMPQLLLLILITAASVPALEVSMSMLGLSPLWPIAIVGCALLGALGLCYGLPRKGTLRFGVGFLCVCLQVWLLKHILNITTAPSTKAPYYYAFGTLFFMLACAVRFADRQLATKHSYVTMHLPPKIWYATKILRSYTGRASLIFAVLSIVLIVIAAKYLHEQSVSIICTASGLVLASFCSDIRSLATLKKPPEIVALRGSWYFVKAQMASVGIGLFAAIPALVYLAFAHTATLDLLLGLLILLIGALSGLAAATGIGAKTRDISSQCAAVFVSCMLFYVCNQFTTSLGNGTALRGVILCALAVVLLLVTFGIEYKRNTYLWRENNE